MQLNQRMVDERHPGKSQPVARQVREWVCPECDYYEEDDGEG